MNPSLILLLRGAAEAATADAVEVDLGLPRSGEPFCALVDVRVFDSLRAYQKSVDAVKSEQRERARVINTPANDEDLFKNPPPRKDCPICAIPMPFGKDVTYLVCCGKEVCGGCVYAMDVANPRRCVWSAYQAILHLSFCSTSDDVQHINICQRSELSSNPLGTQ